MTVLVTGGSKCGKSKYAESIFKNFSGKKYYIAAMEPYGDEAFAAIERHRKMRLGKGFETIEKYRNTGELVFPQESGVLLECMGNLCANEMFSESGICYPADRIVSDMKKISEQTELFVIVTNEVFSDGIEYPYETMEYIRCMGEINRRIAEFADCAVECVFGIPLAIKGEIL